MPNIEQLQAAASWNGERGSALYRQAVFEKNNFKRSMMEKDAARMFINHDRISRAIFLLEHRKR